MGLEQVKTEIISEAERQAKQVEESGAKEAETIKKNAQAEIDNYKAEAQKNFDALMDSMERKELSAARFDAQRAMMDAKREVMDSVVDTVREKLKNLSSDEKQNVLAKLLKQAKEEIDVDVVMVNKKDTSLVKFSKVEEADIIGGLVAQNKDGSISVDLSFEELLDQARQENLEKLSVVLFG